MIHRIAFFFYLALVITAVACANSVNLAVARIVARTRQIAARKAVGARRRDLVMQSIAEAIVICACGLPLGLGLASYEPVAGLFDHPVTGDTLVDWRFVAGTVSALLLIALLTGLYPGALATRIPVRDIGRGSRRLVTSGLRARDVLIVGQLACAVVFICSTIVIRAQTQQMTSADLGFDKDRVLTTRYVFNDSVMLSKRDVIKEAFRRTPGVEAATTLWPGPGMEWVLRMVYPEADPTNGFEAQMLGVDEDFLETYGVKLLAGRNLFPDGVDSGAVQYILNETAVDRLGCAGPTEALGRALRIGGSTSLSGTVGPSALYCTSGVGASRGSLHYYASSGGPGS